MIFRAPFFALVLTIGCAPKTTNTEETVHEEVVTPDSELPDSSAPGVSPRWRVGDEWDIHYRISVPSPKKVADPPPAFEEYGWRYTVERIADDGQVLVVALPTERRIGESVIPLADPQEPWRMRFAGSGAFLVLERPHRGAEEIPTAPYVTTFEDGSVELANEWPMFPLRPGQSTRSPDGSLEQRVEDHNEALRVTMIARSSDEEATEELTVIQQWERNRPWWSSVTTRRKSTWRGETYDDFVLEAHVTSWRLKEDE